MDSDDIQGGLSTYKTRKSLLLRLKHGNDEGAWCEFHSLYGRLIFSYALCFRITHAEAEDIMQEVCIKVFRQIFRFDYSPERGRFRGWLKTITHNTVKDYFRRKQSRHKASIEYREHFECERMSEVEIKDEIWQSKWEKALYEAAFECVRKRIGQDTCEAFRLYVLEDQSAEVVAEISGLETNAVYAVKNRVLKYIREEVKNILESEWGDTYAVR